MSKNNKEINEIIPLKEKIFYGAGEIFGGGSSSLISITLLFFLNTIVGISASIAGAIIMISKAWDAVSDPLMGVISDNCRSKMGRRRPFIILGGVLTFIAMLILFAPLSASAPTWLKISYFAFAYIFYCTASTVSQVPYCSLSSDISPNAKQRNSANSIKLVFSMASAGICYLVPTLVLEQLKNGNITYSVFYLIIGVVFGLYFAIPLILAGIFSRERVEFDVNHRATFSFKNYSTPFKVKSFNWHMLMYVSVFLCMDIVFALVVYFATNVMYGVTIFGKKMSSLFILAPMMVMIAIMLPIVLTAAKKKSKQFALRFAMPCYILGGLLLAFMPTSWPSWLVPIFAIIMGIGFAGAQSMPWMIFPDTVDVAELGTGTRDSASFSGVMTFTRKMSNAVGIGLVGLTLDLAGQVKDSVTNKPFDNQPSSVLWAIRIVMAVAIVVLISLAFFASLKYRVTDTKMKRVKYFNDMHREGKDGELSEDEWNEKIDLVAELYSVPQSKILVKNTTPVVVENEIAD
ncbi:MAG: MFS transporter [Clostridia bacterium]